MDQCAQLYFQPSRDAGRLRLQGFLTHAGRDYAATRNFDHGPASRHNISMLSPYLRHRLLTEEETIKAVLGQHSFSGAAKFIQEVCWRTYWKGWLEMRPEIWTRYRHDAARLQKELTLAENGETLAKYRQAVAGKTGIDAFDSWVGELTEYGYLHNHARMWFASIWIFTLRLPWQLGADLFFRHLYDGDPASNTLSWRWVAGLHTVGKTYLARPGNIEKYTGGRFTPSQDQLAAAAPPLAFDGHPQRQPIPSAGEMPPGKALLLLTEEDCHAESLVPKTIRVQAVAALDPAAFYPPTQSQSVIAFKQAALRDAMERAAAHFQCGFAWIEGEDFAAKLARQAEGAGVTTLIAASLPVGPCREFIEGLKPALAAKDLELKQIRRAWDNEFWPYASAGFFKLQEKIPFVLGKLVLQEA
jgi:deoxyribodipyrimidine photo-lyase